MGQCLPREDGRRASGWWVERFGTFGERRESMRIVAWGVCACERSVLVVLWGGVKWRVACWVNWSYGVMVSTLDFESSDPGSSPGRTCISCLFALVVCVFVCVFMWICGCLCVWVVVVVGARSGARAGWVGVICGLMV